MSSNDDPEIVIRLPLSSWRIIMQHLRQGTFDTVSSVIGALCEQADPQIVLAAAAAPPKAIATGVESPAPTPTGTERLN